VQGWQVRLFGEAAVEWDGRRLALPSGRAMEMLCYLVVHRTKVHTREALAEALWPDAEPAASRKYLRQALWRLTTAMRAAVRRTGGAELVVVDATSVRMNPDAAYWCDVDVFERAYTATRDARGHALTDAQAHDLEAALQLYRGDLLAAWYHDWCGAERDRLQLAQLAMLEQLMGHCEARGLHAKGVGLGQVVLERDPARESAHRQLMRLHLAAGNRAAAARQYQRCTTALAEEFGVAPSAETDAVHELVRTGRPLVAAAGGGMPVPAPRSGGEPGLVEYDDLRLQLDRIHAGVLALQGAGVRGGAAPALPEWKPPDDAYRSGAEPHRGRPAAGGDTDGVRSDMGGGSYANSLEHVLAELARLDVLLAGQVRRSRRSAGVVEDGLSAYYVPDAEVDVLLARRSGEPVTGDDRADDPELERVSSRIAERVGASVRAGVHLRLVALAELFDLEPFDLDVVVMCLAPEVDRSYERLYGYLNDDVTRRLPTVDLVLDLLCGSSAARVVARTRFSPAAPLLRHRLVALTEDPAQPSCSLLDRGVRLAPRIAGFLLGDDAIVEPLRPHARVVVPTCTLDELHFPAEFGESVARLAEHGGGVHAAGQVVYCQGPYGVGRRSVAAACARSWGATLLVVSAPAVAARPADELAALIGLVEREARLRGAVMYWQDADALLAADRRPQLALLLAALAAHPGPAFLAGERRWEPTEPPAGMTFVRLEFPRPGHAERVRCWTSALDGAAGTGLDLAAVSGRFRLTGGQIRDAAATARNLALARDPGEPRITQRDLETACRLQSNRALGELAQQITPRHAWDDIVLPVDQARQLREIADQVRHRALVYETWGFERTISSSRGMAALFTGPPGTGKTMAAEVLAHELGMDLYKIDLSTVVSKFIGETEKNLSRIFDEAATSNAVLFFDEADALFGKRSQVRDSHDRYANLEVSHLLQRMEQHEGVVVLATNLRKNLDDAFVRRLHATVEFPVPGPEDRLRIWRRTWPADAPLEPGVDLAALARTVDLPGGSIRNIALAAAFLAAADGGVVGVGHLLRATRREFQKMGKVLTAHEFAAGSGGVLVEHDAKVHGR
jgi:DNA-binding SARP family transcriptional activator